ncbi:YdaE family protein [Citrobacter koseri]|nr:YdaE family protein [Citrobacter koseri]MDT7485888.1 YdaE family protein [Citrobacter koseri]
MQKECGYCRKPVEEGKEVKSILFYRNGNYPKINQLVQDA